MPRSVIRLLVVSVLLLPALCLGKSSPFAGRWGFTITMPNGTTRGAWLGITDNAGQLEIWYQPTGGNVYQVKDFQVTGKHLTLNVAKASGNRPATTWELDAVKGKLTGIQKRGDATTSLTGLPAPPLKRKAPKSWTTPEPLFNGKDLTGWVPIGNPANSHWAARDGMLVNEAHGANLQTVRKFDDFKLHFEVNCPDHANSGFYLRGRYEIQLEYEPLSANPPERRIGSIYGRIAPAVDLPRTPGEWETYDVTLVGRILTVVRNGKTTIDQKELEGITGGAIDAKEGEPGPFYIQGDHTGGLKFRNITISLARR